VRIRWGDLQRTALQEGIVVTAYSTPLSDIVAACEDIGLDMRNVLVVGSVDPDPKDVLQSNQK